MFRPRKTSKPPLLMSSTIRRQAELGPSHTIVERSALPGVSIARGLILALTAIKQRDSYLQLPNRIRQPAGTAVLKRGCSVDYALRGDGLRMRAQR